MWEFKKVTEPRSGDDGIARRDLREICRAWGLGDTDKMQVLLMSAFLREFGKAPASEEAEQLNRKSKVEKS